MDFALSPRATDLQQRLLAFMEEVVIPAEPVFAEEMRASGDPHFHPHVMEELKAEAKKHVVHMPSVSLRKNSSSVWRDASLLKRLERRFFFSRSSTAVYLVHLRL